MIEWQTLFQIIVIVALTLAFFGWILAHLFWHVKPSHLDSLAELTAQIGRGEPALIYFYSNF